MSAKRREGRKEREIGRKGEREGSGGKESERSVIGEEGEEEKDYKEKEVDKEREKGSWRDKREGVRETNVSEEKRREERKGI